jgi:glucan endo-1,3-alpha-glucosidase
VHFVPSFFIDPASFKGTSVIDGAFSVSRLISSARVSWIDLSKWNSAWPISLNAQSSDSQVHFASLDLFQGDKSYIQNLGGRTYMAGISPWFFTVS